MAPDSWKDCSFRCSPSSVAVPFSSTWRVGSKKRRWAVGEKEEERKRRRFINGTSFGILLYFVCGKTAEGGVWKFMQKIPGVELRFSGMAEDVQHSLQLQCKRMDNKEVP